MIRDKKQICKMFGAIAGVLVLGGLVGWAVKPCCPKVALINVEQVVAVSPEVVALREERQSQVNELQKFMKTAESKINAAKGKEKAELQKIYGDEFVQKQQEMQKRYAEKLQAFDDYMTGVIEKIAAKGGYKLVLNKTAVVAGGTDITEDVVKAVAAEKK